MATTAGTLELVARELAVALRALEEHLTDSGAEGLLAELGLRPPAGLTGLSELAGAVTAAAGAAADLAPLLAQLSAAITADDTGQIIATGTALVRQIGVVIAAVEALGPAVDAAAAAAPGLSIPQRALISAFASELPGRLLDFLTVEYLATRFPTVTGALNTIGVLDRMPDPGDLADPLRPPYLRRAVHPDRIGQLLSDPVGYAQAVYGWGAAGFDGVTLFEKLHRYLERDLGQGVVLLRPAGQPPILEAYVVALRVDDTTSPPNLAFSLRFPGAQDYTRTYALRSPWVLQVVASGRFPADVQGRITPPAEIDLRPPGAATATVSVSGAVVADGAGQPILIFGAAGGTRLEAQRVALSCGLVAEWNPGDGRAAGFPEVTAEIEQGRFIISLADADGFLNSFLPSELSLGLDLGAEWDPAEGLRLRGGAALALLVPLDVELGPARLHELELAFRVDGTGAGLDARLTGDIALGPFSASVEGIGARASLRFTPGNLGPVDLAFDFLAPRGLGLSINAGPVRAAVSSTSTRRPAAMAVCSR